MRLGVDTYSLKDQGWDAFQMLDYAASLGLDNVHFSERRFFESLDAGYLRSVKNKADELGITIEVGMGSFDRFSNFFQPALGSGEEQLSAMIDAALVVNSPVVRCFLGMEVDRKGPVPFQQHIDECVRVLRAVAPKCKEAGVKIAVENHGGVDLLARELLQIIETVGFDTVGACLDTGNPAYGAEDPLLSAELLAPYAITSHVRDTRIWADEAGAQAQWAPLGQGNVNLKAIIAGLERVCPTTPVDLEIITGRGPKALPYFDPGSDFWRTYPKMLARDLVRYINLARHGVAQPLEQITVDIAKPGVTAAERAAFVAQQREHFEMSVRYAREHLGFGPSH